MKKIKLKKILILVLWITVASGIIGLLSFVSVEGKAVKGKAINVIVTNESENSFVNETDIVDFLNERKDSLVNQKMKDMDVNGIEKSLKAHPAISNADVSVDINGNAEIKITQRKPVVRIMNYFGESYYIDDEAGLMPISENYTARVPVANGLILEKYNMFYNYGIPRIEKDSLMKQLSVLDDIYAVSKYISEDSLLTSLIQQLYINTDKEIELYPAVGGHKIIFGKGEDIEEKFEKLKVFYREGLNSIDSWNKYSSINLKYKSQVVCIKR